MNHIRQILSLLSILAFVSVNAEIVIWTIPPNYNEIKRFSQSLYLFQDSGKWGIINMDNNIVLSATYDFITPFVNGYALAGSKHGNRYLLSNIIQEDGNVIEINDSYYLTGNYQYFSEDKLAVSNNNRKCGYINPKGEIVVRCQFDNALPFKEGYAPVKQGNYMKFISEDYDRNASRNTLRVDFHDGEMTDAGCFSNGLAPVSYNKDYAMIDEYGQMVKKIKEPVYRQTCKSNNSAPVNNSTKYSYNSSYSEYSENGKIGLKQGNHVIVTPQFDSFEDIFSDGNIVATMNGKKGLLHTNEGDVTILSKVNGVEISELEVDRNGNTQPITIDCNIPINLCNYRILLDDGSGQLIDKTSEFTRNGNSLFANIYPFLGNNAGLCDTRIVVENDGIVLADKKQSYTISYPINLLVSLSYPTESRANARDYATATITAKIKNDSYKETTVNVTWSTGINEQLIIPPHSVKNSTIQISENNVQREYTKSYVLKLDTGEKYSCNIKFIPFF